MASLTSQESERERGREREGERKGKREEGWKEDEALKVLAFLPLLK